MLHRTNRSRVLIALLSLGGLLLALIASQPARSQSSYAVYAPLVGHQRGATPTVTITPTVTVTRTPTATRFPPLRTLPPTRTPTPKYPPAPTAVDPFLPGVVIWQIVYTSGDPFEPEEFVEITNTTFCKVSLEGWTLSDNDSHVFTFPASIIAPGQTCRVYTNQDHPESCGFSFGSSTPIWDNTGGCASLRDETGALISQLCY